MAQEKEQEWDQEKGPLMAKGRTMARSTARVRQSGLVLAHLLPPGLESAQWSALVLELPPGMAVVQLDLGLALDLELGLGMDPQKALAWV